MFKVEILREIHGIELQNENMGVQTGFSFVFRLQQELDPRSESSVLLWFF